MEYVLYYSEVCLNAGYSVDRQKPEAKSVGKGRKTGASVKGEGMEHTQVQVIN